MMALAGDTERQGRHAIIEQFLADGMTVMFGNPGTVEQGFLQALDAYPEMKYILTLQESIAVFAGDGHARATKKPTIVQIHSSPGLGNALGAIYQAKRGHSPLVVIGGDAGVKYLPMQAQMYADLVAMAAPVTKASMMVQDRHSLLRVLRRAIKIAATPPMGPVYICLPADILDIPNDEAVFPTSIPQADSVASSTDIEKAADVLIAADRPRIFIGDGVHYSHGAGEAITRLATMIGADIFGVDSGEANVPLAHPLYRGQTGHMFGEQSKPITMATDAAFIAGTYMVPEVFPDLGDIYDPKAKIIHVDLDADQIAKNHRVDIGMIADPARTISAIVDAIAKRRSAADAAKHAERADRLRGEIAAQRAKDHAAIEAEAAHSNATMAALAREFFKRVKNPVVVDEALTNSPALVHYLAQNGGEDLIQTRGGSLGMGLASALGVQIAKPDRTIISVSGDGGGMYTIQSLWSAARHKLPIKYVVCSNGVYHLLQLNILQYFKELGVPPKDQPVAFDLSSPPLKFAEMAKAMSVPSVAVTNAADIPAAVDAALAERGPFLIDLRLVTEIRPELIGVKCGH